MFYTMPQISPNLRLLLSPLKPPLSSSLFSKPKSRTFSFSTVLASATRKRHRNVAYRDYSPGYTRRHRSTFKEGRSRDKAASMEEKPESNASSRSSPSFEFNKRRAAGMDKSDKPKRNLQLKVRRLNPTNTIAYIQILGTGMDTQDTSPSVLLFFDKQRFIFNAGEGLQRFCTEHKIKLSKIDHIFLSRVCSETAGGLPGLLLTLAGTGEEGISVNVWGPSDLNYLVDAMRSFIPRAAMVHAHSFEQAASSDSMVPPDSPKSGEPIVLVNDEVVKISAILLQPHGSEVSTVKSSEMSVIYMCELPEIMGKFDPKKATALGLRPGPKFRELQSGNSVKSDRQNIMVHPSDVMGPPVPGPIVFLVDCPTQSHAEELLSTASLSNYYSGPSDKTVEGVKTVNCIIHLSPASVINSQNYQDWMKRFSSSQHIIAGHEAKNMEVPILKSSARIAARLNYLCPQFFPAPGFWSLQHRSISASESVHLSKGSDSNHFASISAENLLKFTLRPYAQLGLDKSCIPNQLTSSEVINELLSESPEIVDVAEYLRRSCQGQEDKGVIEEPWLSDNTLPSSLQSVRRDDLEIVLLGTGSSQPSKYRNVTSIYIDLFSKGSLLLDCGEGSLGQLKRRYGVEGADNAVRKLTCIWISHIHADHHAGLARILALRRDLLKGVPHEPLLVVGPRQLKRFLDAYQRLEDLDMEFLDCRSTTEASWDAFEGNVEVSNDKNSLFERGSPMQSVWKKPGSPIDKASSASETLKNLKAALNEAGLESLISFPVVHCPQAFGIALQASERVNSLGKTISGWKMVYSGDTRPCPELVEASRGATILIHEATFEDGMVEEAVAKNHSTTKEAIEVGSAAGVYRIILTHFSQRYPKIPVIDETHMHKTCIAFDLMSINLADLPVLPKVVPYLKSLFRNEIVEDEPEDVVDAITSAL